MSIAQPLQVFFAACMRGLMPLRRRGAFGTPDEPRYFKAGEAVPWWAECRWPLGMRLTFAHDSESYYEDGEQVIRTLFVDYPHSVLEADRAGCLIVGAPTLLSGKPRRRVGGAIQTQRSQNVAEASGTK
jgi:hypothetical protein